MSNVDYTSRKRRHSLGPVAAFEVKVWGATWRFDTWAPQRRSSGFDFSRRLAAEDADEAADGVLLPARRLDDLRQCRPFGALHEGDHLGLLARSVRSRFAAASLARGAFFPAFGFFAGLRRTFVCAVPGSGVALFSDSIAVNWFLLAALFAVVTFITRCGRNSNWNPQRV
jgi:hypothetical protein